MRFTVPEKHDHQPGQFIWLVGEEKKKMLVVMHFVLQRKVAAGIYYADMHVCVFKKN